MRYATSAAFRAALEQRLLNSAHEAGIPVTRLRKLVVFERLMARLLVVARDRWILKDAVALHFRLGARSRPTKDLDLARYDSEQAATADFLAAQALDLGDYFQFDIRKTAGLGVAPDVATARYHVVAELAGRLFEEVTVDIGFGDAPFAHAEELRGSDLLSFAGIPLLEVPAIPLEPHVAEKVHAYTRSYAGGHHSTRTKDLVDLILISSRFQFSAGPLRNALQATFSTRDTHPLPAILPPPPSAWSPAYRNLAADVRLDPNLSAGFQAAGRFLDPILGGAVSDAARWDPNRRTW